jgi:hypothetical protein
VLAPTTLLALILPGTLFAHVVAQTAAVLRRQVTPARRTFLAAKLAFLLPVFAHLLAHLAPLIRRQVAPVTLRPDAASRSQQAQQQQREKEARFHGKRCKTSSDAIIVHPPGPGKHGEM